MSAVPLERVTWELYSPFRAVRASAEFTFADKNRKTSARMPSLRGRSYTSSRYSQTLEVASVELSSSDYLVLRHRDHDLKITGNTAGKVIMSYPHLPRFIGGLLEVLDALRDGCFEQGEDGTFALTEKGERELIQIEDLHGGASLGFQPVVFDRQADDGEETAVSDRPAGEPGVRMFLNSWDFFSDARLLEFDSFIRFYERFDLFATARTATAIAAGQGAVTIPSLAPAPQPVRQPPVARTRSGLSAGRPATK